MSPNAEALDIDLKKVGRWSDAERVQSQIGARLIALRFQDRRLAHITPKTRSPIVRTTPVEFAPCSIVSRSAAPRVQNTGSGVAGLETGCAASARRDSRSQSNITSTTPRTKTADG